MALESVDFILNILFLKAETKTKRFNGNVASGTWEKEKCMVDLSQIKYDWKVMFLLKFLITQLLFYIVNAKTHNFLNTVL